MGAPRSRTPGRALPTFVLAAALVLVLCTCGIVFVVRGRRARKQRLAFQRELEHRSKAWRIALRDIAFGRQPIDRYRWGLIVV